MSILSRFIGIITPMNRNPPYTEASVTKQEKTALNMARFIRSQTLTLLEKLNELDADEQADICESLHDHADELYRSCRLAVSNSLTVSLHHSFRSVAT